MKPTGSIPPTWLLLVLTIPGRQPACRMRVWRKLKLLGAGVLRDGVYVLPNQSVLHSACSALADEVVSAGGTAQLLEVGARDAEFAALFDRTDEYRELIKDIGAAGRALKSVPPQHAARTAERLRKEFESIASRDFFPAALQGQAREALDHLRALTERRVSPDEPQAAHGRIRRLNRSEYHGRTWATRANPWVDRLASAWLIRRFIDSKAKFRWLKALNSNPKKRRLGDVLGFDFDGAAFTHIDDKVTFEVLMISFGLDHDPALQRLGAIVHYLDLGGLPVPEASTVESLLRGMQERAEDDDGLLSHACVLFDDLYAGYTKEQAGS